MSKISSGKEILISTLETTEINFLMSLKGLNPELVSKQFKEDVNHLAWIVGHCVSHMDSFLSIYTEERKLNDEERDYYAFGVSKEKIRQYNFSFRDTIENYLLISKNFFEELYALEESQFFIKPFSDARENLYQFIQRITLHIMGHTGQIVLIRRILGDPFWSFIGGVAKKERDEIKKEWLQWWKENKNEYH